MDERYDDAELDAVLADAPDFQGGEGCARESDPSTRSVDLLQVLGLLERAVTAVRGLVGRGAEMPAAVVPMQDIATAKSPSPLLPLMATVAGERMPCVSVDGAEGLAVTAKAVLIVFGPRLFEHWFPYSQLADENEVRGKGHRGRLVFRRWLAEQNGWVEAR